MRKLLVYLKQHWGKCVLAPAFKLLEALFELFVPLLVAQIIDQGILGSDRPFVVKGVLLMVLLGVVGMAAAVTAQYFAAKTATAFGKDVRHSLFAHIGTLSYTELDQIGTATLITRMSSDIQQVQNCVNLVLRLFMRSPFVVFGAMVMAFTVDSSSALWFVVAIPLLSVVVFGVILSTIPLYKKVQAKLDRVTELTRENLKGARVIRAFRMEEREKAMYEKETEALSSLQVFAGKISALMNPLTFVIVNLAICGLLYTGALRVNSGSLSQGEVIALINYMSQILVELVKLANLIVTITKAVACGNRIEKILETKSTLVSPSSPVPLETGNGAPAISFEGVGLTYQGAAEGTLKSIDFSVMPGESLGIIGGTGSGKTSLLNLIPRFYDATEGRVLLFGKDVKAYETESVRGAVGIVPQRAVLFHGTIRSNLLWGAPEATEEEMWRALEIARAKDFVLEKEGGLDAPVSEGGKNFSGGQKQRLTIARALIKKPKILILDDAASALDMATEAALRRAILEACQDTTLLCVSQRASSVRTMDRILCLEDGEAVGLGTHEELLSSCAVYREIYESQYGKEETDG